MNTPRIIPADFVQPYSLSVIAPDGKTLFVIERATPPREHMTLDEFRGWLDAEAARMLAELEAWGDGIVIAMHELAAVGTRH